MTEIVDNGYDVEEDEFYEELEELEEIRKDQEETYLSILKIQSEFE